MHTQMSINTIFFNKDKGKINHRLLKLKSGQIGVVVVQW